MAGHWFDTILDNVTGRPVAGATIEVYTAAAAIAGDSVSSGTFATIFSDDGVTTIDQAGGSYVTSDGRGFAEFWTNETSVVLEISYAGEAKKAILDVEIIGGAVASDVTALAVRVDKHDTLIGTAANAEDLGAFSGTTITSNTDVKTALQELETAVEAAAAQSQPDEMLAGFIASPADKDYRLVVKMAHGGTITETTTRSVSGTCTATFKVNTTALGGTANSVSSSEQSQAHASSNTFVAGDDIVLTVSSNSACVDLSFNIKYTRTLA